MSSSLKDDPIEGMPQMNGKLLESVKSHWLNLRGRTYDLMDVLEDDDLNARLPFTESQDVLNQFYCMLGTQESWPPVLLDGRMKEWGCSLTTVFPGEGLAVAKIRKAMEAADEVLFGAFKAVDWLFEFQDGNTPLAGYFRLAEHEAHHHGQLINFIYACKFPIPKSWVESWALTREEI